MVDYLALVILLSIVVVTLILARAGRRPTADEVPPSRLGNVLTGLALVVLSAPIAVFATLAAFPIWSTLERTTGVEAVGHSGPSEWCYVVTYAVVIVLLSSRWFSKLRSEGAPS
jgi:hypothetical protein